MSKYLMNKIGKGSAREDMIESLVLVRFYLSKYLYFLNLFSNLYVCLYHCMGLCMLVENPMKTYRRSLILGPRATNSSEPPQLNAGHKT